MSGRHNQPVTSPQHWITPMEMAFLLKAFSRVQGSNQPSFSSPAIHLNTVTTLRYTDEHVKTATHNILVKRKLSLPITPQTLSFLLSVCNVSLFYCKKKKRKTPSPLWKARVNIDVGYKQDYKEGCGGKRNVTLPLFYTKLDGSRYRVCVPQSRMSH